MIMSASSKKTVGLHRGSGVAFTSLITNEAREVVLHGHLEELARLHGIRKGGSIGSSIPHQRSNLSGKSKGQALIWLGLGRARALVMFSLSSSGFDQAEDVPPCPTARIAKPTGCAAPNIVLEEGAFDGHSAGARQPGKVTVKQAPLPAGFEPASNDPPSCLARTSAIFMPSPFGLVAGSNPGGRPEPSSHTVIFLTPLQR